MVVQFVSGGQIGLPSTSEFVLSIFLASENSESLLATEDIPKTAGRERRVREIREWERGREGEEALC